jgi:hypothetical protein
LFWSHRLLSSYTVKCSNNLEQLCHLCSTLVDCPLLLLIVYLSVFKFWLLTVIVRTQNLLSGPIQLDISRMFLILFLSILLSHYLCHALYPVTRTQQVTIWNTWNKLWLVFQKKVFPLFQSLFSTPKLLLEITVTAQREIWTLRGQREPWIAFAKLLHGSYIVKIHVSCQTPGTCKLHVHKIGQLQLKFICFHFCCFDMSIESW